VNWDLRLSDNEYLPYYSELIENLKISGIGKLESFLNYSLALEYRINGKKQMGLGFFKQKTVEFLVSRNH
jgi:hypothetical protein